MTEVQTQSQAATYNPLDPETFSTGGGLWDGKTVTVTRAVCKTEQMTTKDGKPVLDEQTKQPVIQTALTVWGISDGGDDKERYETYGAGDKLVATPDGEGFVDKVTGGPPKFHANSGIGKFAAGIKAGGYDIGNLMVNGKLAFSRLAGARFTMRAEAKLGKDGKPIKDKKGYTKQSFFPVKYVGQAQGGNGHVPTPPTPGVSATPGPGPQSGDALRTKAVGAVLQALAGGPLSRAQLIAKLAGQLAGDADSNGIIGLVVDDRWHKDQPWKYDGKTASL